MTAERGEMGMDGGSQAPAGPGVAASQSQSWDMPRDASPEDQAMYQALLDGMDMAQRAYADKPGRATLDALGAARQALADFRREMDARHGTGQEDARPLATMADYRPTSRVADVFRHLQAMGYEVRRSTVYLHAKQGLLRRGTGGVYTPTMVRKYIEAAGLVRPGHAPGDSPLDPDAPATPEDLSAMSMEDLERAKRIEEIRRLQAQAAREALKAERESGQVIPREDLNIERAARAVALSAELRQLVVTESPVWVAMVGGDPRRSHDLADAILRAWDGMVGRYVRPDDIEVVLEEDMDQEAGEAAHPPGEGPTDTAARGHHAAESGPPETEDG